MVFSLVFSRTVSVLLLLTLLKQFQTGTAVECSSQSLSSYNESSFSGGEFSSGIQLLIPSWNFTCHDQGTITSWTAHVTGDTSIADLFEFQIFEPDSVKDGVYHAVYGNLYRGDNAQDSMITVPVDNIDNIFIPIRPGYIVGVYIPPSVANNLSLLYEDTGDTDVYYWENIENRTCEFSLCSGKVMRNINPLIEWTFVETSLTLIETNLGVLKQNTKYCTEVKVSDCIEPTHSSSPSSTPTPKSHSTTTSNPYVTSSAMTTSSRAGVTQLQSTSTTTTTVSPYTVSLNRSPSVTSTPTPNNTESVLQMGLVLAVAGLLVMSIILTCTLIVLLLIKCCRRATYMAAKANRIQDGHVVTDVNPSYRVHNILNTDLYESQNKKEIEVQDYCEPEPSNRTTLSYTHTYNNDTNNRICFQQSESIYEDMYTL